MKSDEPLLSLTRFLTKYIKKILKFSIVKKLTIIKKILSVLGQSINIFDQYIKYRIGMAFADSGFGVTIFERYITDKLRGEFPNINNKLLPLEQFFPFPDGMFYIDVMPHKSISRKIKDKHTISEMTSKRKNYISLLKECDEVKIVSCDNDLKTNIKELKNYIFELALKKKKQLKSGYRIKRCAWKKNKNRILAGDPKYRFQKGNFL
jgi:hypothetical protein